MERSRGRTLLGLALLVIGVIWLSSALARSFAGPPPLPALPPVPAVRAMPDMPAPPDLPAMPELPAMPAAPSLPELPAMPELPPLPPLPADPPAHPFHVGFPFSPPIIALVAIALLVWWRGRGTRERPAA